MPAPEKSWRRLADITANAFANDPVNRWIFGNERAIASCFRVLAREIYAKRGICHFAYDTRGVPVGATMWAMSDTNQSLSTIAQLSLALGVSRHGSSGALRRAQTAGEIMNKHHPKTPHLYLFTIGVVPSGRGKGFGHALLHPVLSACDAAGLPCYLENSNPANFGFYGAHGFEHVEHFAAGDGGPPLQAMWRSASPDKSVQPRDIE